MSRRLAIFLGAGIVPILAGSFFGLGFVAFLFYNLVLLALWVADLLITPGKNRFEAERVCEEKFSMGAGNPVMIRVRNNSNRNIWMLCKDEIPDYFRLADRKKYVVSIRIPPHEETEGRYDIIPLKRGEYRFGSIHARIQGILGLCEKKAIFDAAGNYKVYPNLQDLRRYSLAAIHRSELMSGAKKDRVYGIGTEFESLREYSDGDDYRKINWMATARANHLVVNTYQPERNQQVFILLDSSRVMNSEIHRIKKLDYAINSAFLLADVALRKGDNAGLLVFDQDVRRFVKPGKGPGHFHLIAENLYNVEENMVTADYRNALLHLNEQQKRRSLLCIFTDLFNTDEALELASSLKNLARRHVPLVITIRDERLFQTADQSVRESEDAYLKSAAMKLVEERKKIKRIFTDSGIACIDALPDRLSIDTVNKYLQMKSTLRL